MLTRLVPQHHFCRPRGRAVRRTALVLCALVGVWLGCARAKPTPGVWFDVCCKTCTADYCEDCTETKGECGGEIGEREGECLLHNDMMMCRPEPRI
jgi:hypothetical protein